MLSHILDHLKTLNLEELRALNRSVCGAIKGTHQEKAQRAAAKFTPGGYALYMGQKVTIQNVGHRHLYLANGATVPVAHCRPLSK